MFNESDFLFIYSDGFSEAKNEREEFFGTSRILGILPEFTNLSANEFSERLLKEVKNFIGSARPNDDISLMVLKRLG